MGRRSFGVQIATRFANGLPGEFLVDAVMAENRRHRRAVRAIVREAVDLVGDGVDLELIVALDVGEAVGPAVDCSSGR